MRIRTAITIAAGLAALGVLLLLGRGATGYVPAFARYVDSLAATGALVFVAGYVVATVAMVPGSVLTLTAGALFGLAEGTALVFVAATLGATLAFLIARHGARGFVERRLAGNLRFRAVDAAIGREGRRIAFLIRLSPLFPFNVTNYALGLTRIRLRDYVIACAGMLPGTVLYVYYGRVIGDVARAVSGAPVARNAGYWAVTLLGLAATVVVTLVITRAARRALRDAVDERAAPQAGGSPG